MEVETTLPGAKIPLRGCPDPSVWEEASPASLQQGLNPDRSGFGSNRWPLPLREAPCTRWASNKGSLYFADKKLSLKRVELQALLAPQRSAPPPRSFARSFLKFCVGQQGSPARTAAPRPKPGLTPPPPSVLRAAARPPRPLRLVGPAPVSTPPPEPLSGGGG